MNFNLSRFAKISFTLIIIILFSFCLFYYFSQRNLVYNLDFSNTEKDKELEVKGLVKKHSLEEDNNGQLYEVENYAMTQDEIDIRLKVPQNFQYYKKLSISTKFQNPVSPIFRIGLFKKVNTKLSSPAYDYEYRTLDNKYLNEYKSYLGEEWTYISDRENPEIVLFQKGTNYKTVTSFLRDSPAPFEKFFTETDKFGIEQRTSRKIPQIATLDYTLKPNPKFKIPRSKEREGAGNGEYTNIPYSFRGSFEMYVYMSQSDVLRLDFLKQDLNQRNGEDQVEVKVFDYKKQPVYYRLLEDDGIIDNSKIINIQNYTLEVPLKEKELYTIKVVSQSSGNDYTLRNIQVNSSKVLLNNFTVVDNEETATNMINKPFNFYTPKEEVQFSIIGREYEQEIFINDKSYFLPWEDFERRSFELNDSMNEIRTTLNGVSIRASHPVSLKPENFFDTQLNRTQDFKLGKNSDINFLVANYNFPEKEDSSSISNVWFTTENLFFDEETEQIHLKLRADGLTGYGGSIVFENMTFTLEK